jgi:hypothetical protein
MLALTLVRNAAGIKTAGTMAGCLVVVVRYSGMLVADKSERQRWMKLIERNRLSNRY